MIRLLTSSEHSSYSEIQTFLSAINYGSISFIVPEQGAGDLLKELSEKTKTTDISDLFKSKQKE